MNPENWLLHDFENTFLNLNEKRMNKFQESM